MSGRPEDNSSLPIGQSGSSYSRSQSAPAHIGPTHVEIKPVSPLSLTGDSPAKSAVQGPVPVGPDAVITETQITNARGLVKWFDPRKGFGFIVGPDGQDIFAHFSMIEGEGFRVLKDSSTVLYDASKSDKGWKATRIRRIDPVDVVVPPRRGYSRTPRQ